jgi:hypothetical protein
MKVDEIIDETIYEIIDMPENDEQSIMIYLSAYFEENLMKL